MAIKEIKSKINDNKQEKERKLLNTALHFQKKELKKLLFKILLKMQVLLKELFICILKINMNFKMFY